MDEATYKRLKLHIESLRWIVTQLETTIGLAYQLEPFGLANAEDEAAGATAENLQRMLDHILKVECDVGLARQRIEKVAKLMGTELQFAQAARRAALRSAGESSKR